MLTAILRNGPCDGERIHRLSEYTRSVWRSPAGQHTRYEHSGILDPATGWPIFVYAPLRLRKAR
jgi:hypothetical protein